MSRKQFELMLRERLVAIDGALNRHQAMHRGTLWFLEGADTESSEDLVIEREELLLLL
jgi:hypothetical protein